VKNCRLKVILNLLKNNINPHLGNNCLIKNSILWANQEINKILYKKIISQSPSEQQFATFEHLINFLRVYIFTKNSSLNQNLKMFTKLAFLGKVRNEDISNLVD
jgi:hypothetical protein